MRPFERYIDDICKGRRSIWDCEKDLPNIAPRIVRSDGSVTRHAIVRYYNLSAWEIYRLEALIEGLDHLKKSGSETSPAAAVAQLCQELLQDQRERTLSPDQSLLKRLWEDMRVHSDDFQCRKDVLLTLDEGQPGFILHYQIRRRTQGDIEDSDRPDGSLRGSRSLHDMQRNDSGSEGEDVKVLIEKAVNTLAKYGCKAKKHGNSYPVTRCPECGAMSVISGESERYFYHPFLYRTDRHENCFRCDYYLNDMEVDNADDTDQDRLLADLEKYLVADEYAIEYEESGMRPRLHKCPKCGEKKLVMAKVEIEKKAGIQYDYLIRQLCLSCHLDILEQKSYYDDYSDLC